MLKDLTDVGTNGDALLDLSTAPLLSTGSHTLTREVTDGMYIPHPTDSMILKINNLPPVVAPQGGGTYQLTDTVHLKGDVSDYDGDTLTYRWFEKIDMETRLSSKSLSVQVRSRHNRAVIPFRFHNAT